MQRSIVELISLEESAQAITFVEKTLAKKLLGVIANQRSAVARDTYGSLGECYGADESPEFMEPADNAYQVFYQNALQKFGVNGPQDFQDENTKQQFFNYLDMNWKAQDTVQQQQVPGVGMQGAPGGTNIDLGTQTQLPAQATQPQPPQGQAQPNNPNLQQQGLPQQPQPVQMPNQKMPMGGSEDPSIATMAPTGPSIDKTAPLGPDGDDSELDGLQDTQTQDGRDGFNPAMGGADQFGNGPDDDDQDPNLEIGDDDSDQNGFGNDDDEMDLSGDNEDQGDEQVPNSSEFGDDDDQQGGNGDSDDDPFGEDDAYTVDPSDFSQGGDDDQGDDDQFGDDDDDQDQNRDGGFGDDDSDNDDQGDDDSDPDLEIGDDDDDSDNEHPDKHSDNSNKKPAPKPTSDDSDQSDDDKTKETFSPKKKPFGESMKPSDRSRKTRKNDSAKATRLAGKKESKLREGEDGEIDDGTTFGEDYAADNAADAAFLEERMKFYQATKKQMKTDKSIPPDQRRQRLGSVDGDLKMSVRRAQRDLNIIKAGRDQSHQHWRKMRADVKNSNKSPQEKEAALHQISQSAKQDLAHWRQKAETVKGIHTGKTGGADAGWHGHSQGMHEEVLGEMVQHTVTHPNGRTKVHITANQKEGPFSSRMYVNGGETATNTSAKHKTLTGAKKWADKAMKKHHGE